MAYIEFNSVNKYFGQQHVLKDLTLAIEKDGFVTLLGSSGCGKSTLLRLLAGLEQVTSGRIFLDGEDITFKNPRERQIGMIFQQYSLFPTMNVYQNVSFGLRMKNQNREMTSRAVAQALEMVELKGSEKKYPYQLSGGEQQRVALARCIVTKPKVLLLDEPFSAIDAKLRKALQSRIKEIHRELRMTTIFVTHDQDEAMAMSDRIHLMNNGVIEQSATPMELYANPRTPFAASFMGNYNILQGQSFSAAVQQEGYRGTIAIRPEQIAISRKEFPADDHSFRFPGIIQERIPNGNVMRYRVKSGELNLTVDTLFSQNHFFEENERICIRIEQSDLIEYPSSTEDTPC